MQHSVATSDSEASPAVSGSVCARLAPSLILGWEEQRVAVSRNLNSPSPGPWAWEARGLSTRAAVILTP